MMLRIMIVAATVLTALSSVAGAANSGVPGKPWAGPVCIKWKVGGVIYGLSATDPSNNGLGRLTALNDAALNGYPVQVSVASDLGITSLSDTISCNDGEDRATLTPALVLPQ